MPNDDENAAEPLLNLRAEIGHLARLFLDGHDDGPPASGSGTPSDADWARQNNNPYHNEMVREANESFRIADEKKRMMAAKTPQRSPGKRSKINGY